MGGNQYVIISSYGLHSGHYRTDIQRPVVDNILYESYQLLDIRIYCKYRYYQQNGDS